MQLCQSLHINSTCKLQYLLQWHSYFNYGLQCHTVAASTCSHDETSILLTATTWRRLQADCPHSQQSTSGCHDACSNLHVLTCLSSFDNTYYSIYRRSLSGFQNPQYFTIVVHQSHIGCGCQLQPECSRT